MLATVPQRPLPLARPTAAQKLCLPGDTLASPCFEAAWTYRPAEEVGGDVLLVRPVGDHRLFVLVADVMGHGLSAALVAASLRGAIAVNQQGGPSSPGPLLSALNRVFPALAPHYFATAVACLLDARARTVTFATAGHPPALLRDPNGLRGLATPSLPLGVLLDSVYEERTAPLAPGASLLLYTDGVSDSLPTPRPADAPPLAALLRDAGPDPAAVVIAIEQAVRAGHVRGGYDGDDRTALVVRSLPPAGPRGQPWKPVNRIASREPGFPPTL